jgi:hypothetical protein
MIKSLTLLRGGCIAAALFSSSLFAATVNGTLQKDVMAKEKFPTTNFGADVQLQTSNQATFRKIIYVQFSVSGIPAGSTGISAQLKLRSLTTGTGRSISAHPVTDTSWTEAGVTWNARPTVGGTTLSTVSSHTSGADSVWAVGGHVTGNGTFALGLDTTYAGDTTFSSREGANDPVLVVTYTPPGTSFNIYRGNTHSHTTYTSSHGEVPPDNGPPSEHHSRAKAAGYDFYITTDHSQEVAFDPTSATNTAWVATKNQAAAASDSTYLGLAGYEHSENNGPGGTGHINVINTNSYLDALESGVDLPALYSWLATVAPNGTGMPIVASFNHPSPSSYNSFGQRTAAATDIITLLEVINSNNGIHEDAYRAANNAGWKVGPTCGNDNHGFWGITNHNSRVGVLAASRSKLDILSAMKARRTFVSTDKNAALHFTANGVIMGSTLSSPSTITFVVTASDPDTGDANDRLTLIQIVDPNNVVVASTTISTYNTVWTSPAVSVSGKKYFYVRARNVGSGTSTMAWTAPIWTGL